jgi:hypothetical protein
VSAQINVTDQLGNVEYEDFSFNGSLTVVPEPASLGLLAGASLLLIRPRRRTLAA